MSALSREAPGRGLVVVLMSGTTVSRLTPDFPGDVHTHPYPTGPHRTSRLAGRMEPGAGPVVADGCVRGRVVAARGHAPARLARLRRLLRGGKPGLHVRGHRSCGGDGAAGGAGTAHHAVRLPHGYGAAVRTVCRAAVRTGRRAARGADDGPARGRRRGLGAPRAPAHPLAGTGRAGLGTRGRWRRLGPEHLTGAAVGGAHGLGPGPRAGRGGRHRHRSARLQAAAGRADTGPAAAQRPLAGARRRWRRACAPLPRRGRSRWRGMGLARGLAGDGGCVPGGRLPGQRLAGHQPARVRAPAGDRSRGCRT